MLVKLEYIFHTLQGQNSTSPKLDGLHYYKDSYHKLACFLQSVLRHITNKLARHFISYVNNI